MQAFEMRETPAGGKVVHDLAMPKNGDTYGGSVVVDPDGTAHQALTHSKLWIWRRDDPGQKTTVTIVYGNGAKEETGREIGPGATEIDCAARGLCSVVEDDAPVYVYADVFPVWVH